MAEVVAMAAEPATATLTKSLRFIRKCLFNRVVPTFDAEVRSDPAIGRYHFPEVGKASAWLQGGP